MPISTSDNKRNNSMIIFFTLLIMGMIYLLSSILLPFVAAALIAYISNPLVKKLMRFHIPRILAVVIVFSIILFIISFLIFFLIPEIIQKQIATLSVQLPNMVTWMQSKIIPWFMRNFTVDTSNQNDLLKNMLTDNIMKAGSAVHWIWDAMLKSGKALFEGIINIILIPVVTFYLLRDWDLILRNIRRSLPSNAKPAVIKIAHECDTVLSAFFRGQLLVMLVLAIMYSVGLSLIGLQLGVIIGLLVGLLSIVPYLGLIIGVTIAVIAALVQFGTSSSVFWVLIIFAIGHSFENFYLTPKLIGHRIGLHPVVVIFAVLAGGTLFGFFGVLLALPVAAVILVLLRHLRVMYHRKRHA